MDEPKAPASGWEYVIAGALIGAIGAVLALVAEEQRIVIAGAVLSWLGATLTAVGAVAVGVTIGVRRARHFDG